MKKIITVIGFLFLSNLTFSQTTTSSVTPTSTPTVTPANTSTVTSTTDATKPEESSVRSNDVSSRISFILGIGASHTTSFLYKTPAINNDGNVIIDAADPIKTNISFGIIYTPLVYDITTYKLRKHNQYDTIITTAAKGITFATFINPITLSGSSASQSFFNNVDFGTGIGWRTASGWLFMVTCEFFVVDQPRKWFVDQYSNNSTKYIVNGATQNVIDPNDKNIFSNITEVTLGFKLCYTFDIVKSYKSQSQNF